MKEGKKGTTKSAQRREFSCFQIFNVIAQARCPLFSFVRIANQYRVLKSQDPINRFNERQSALFFLQSEKKFIVIKVLRSGTKWRIAKGSSPEADKIIV